MKKPCLASKDFPDIQVVGVQLIKDDLDLTKNVLHLDCAFMPLGLGHCIVYKEGFCTEDDYHKITEDYPMENIFHVNQEGSHSAYYQFIVHYSIV